MENNPTILFDPLPPLPETPSTKKRKEDASSGASVPKKPSPRSRYSQEEVDYLLGCIEDVLPISQVERTKVENEFSTHPVLKLKEREWEGVNLLLFPSFLHRFQRRLNLTS